MPLFPRQSSLEGWTLGAALLAGAGALLAARAVRRDRHARETLEAELGLVRAELERERSANDGAQQAGRRRSGEHAMTRAALHDSDHERERSEERFRIVAENSGSMIFDYDLVGGTVYRSDALHSVFKWSEADPTESWWVSLIHPDDVDRVQSIVQPVIRDGHGSRWAAEYRLRRGDDSYATVLERGAIVRNAEGRPLRCLGTVSDVSDRAELASQLRQAQKMEAVGQLAGGIAHDFNNLLTAINCNVELLLDAIDGDDARREDVVQIREAASRAATLTRQLLAFSRRQVLQPRPLDLNGTVGSMERMLRRVIGGEVRLLTQLEPQLAAVHADVGQMEQVVMNLVLNARDAMPAGGTIVLTTANRTLGAALQHRFGLLAPGRYVTLSVNDAGSGISAAVMERLFEPFFTTKVQGKGTGLGLATVHGIVMQSGGQIVVHTTEGRGTEFVVYLPASAGVAPARHTTPRGNVPIPSMAVRTVLVVDDDDAVREVAVRALSRAGYRVLASSGGEAALALLAKQDGRDPLLVLTDVLMPSMNGPVLADYIAERHPAARIAFMSGFSADELARSGLGSPVRALLNKPFSLPELVRFVEDAFLTPQEVDA